MALEIKSFGQAQRNNIQVVAGYFEVLIQSRLENFMQWP